MRESKRFHSLDSFRGLCALSVIVFHIHVVGSFTELNFFRHADLLVEFFFVLSGFVLTHSYGSREHLDFRKFFILRTFRLFPLHVFMLIVFILLEFGKLAAYTKGFAFTSEPFTGGLAPSGFIPNLLLLQAWSPITDNLTFNYPSWSISIEYYMYLIFAATLVLAYTQRKLAWVALSAIAFVLLYIRGDLLTDFPLRGLSCFFAGALGYSAYRWLSAKAPPSFRMATLLEILAFVLVVAVISSDMANQSIVASLLFCAVVVLFAFDAGAVSALLKGRVFALLGKLSYSIYLTHAAVVFCVGSAFMVLQKITGRHITPMINDMRYFDFGSYLVNNLVTVGILLVVVAVSVFTYNYIEVKGQDIGRSIVNRKAAQTNLRSSSVE